jgi:hypothetical protein
MPLALADDFGMWQEVVMIKVKFAIIEFGAKTPVPNATVDLRVVIKKIFQAEDGSWQPWEPDEELPEFPQKKISNAAGILDWEFEHYHVESQVDEIVFITADLWCAGLTRTIAVAEGARFGETGASLVYDLVIELDFAKAIVGHTTHNFTRLWFWLHYPCPANLSGVCHLYQGGAAGALAGLTPAGQSKKTTPPESLVLPVEPAAKKKHVDFAAGRIHKDRPELGHAAAVDFDDLAPATHYTYVLSLENNTVAPGEATRMEIARGTLTTAPLEADKLTFVFASCHLPIEQPYFDVERGPFKRWSALSSRRDYDLMLLIGDQIYADKIGSYWPGDEWFVRFVKRYDQLWIYPNMREVLRRTPTYMVMDDHEVKDDWGTVRLAEADDDDEQDFIAQNRLTAGVEAYRVFQQAHNPDLINESSDGWFYKFRSGPAAFFVLDDRSKRLMPQPNWTGADKSYVLGDKQRQAFDDWANDRETKAADVIVLVAPVPLAFVPVNDVLRLLAELKAAAGEIGQGEGFFLKGAFRGAAKGFRGDLAGPFLSGLPGAVIGSVLGIGGGWWFGKNAGEERAEESFGRNKLSNLTDRDLADLWTYGSNQSDLVFVLDRLFRLANGVADDGRPRRRAVFVLGGDVHSGAMHVIRSGAPGDADNAQIFQLTSSPISNEPAYDETFGLVAKHISEKAHVTADVLRRFTILDDEGLPMLDDEGLKKLVAYVLGVDPAEFALGPEYRAEIADLLPERNFGRIAIERVHPDWRTYRFYLSVEGETRDLSRAIELSLDAPWTPPEELQKGFGFMEFNTSLSVVKVHPRGKTIHGTNIGLQNTRSRIAGIGDVDGDGIDEILLEDPSSLVAGVARHDGNRWVALGSHAADWVHTVDVNRIKGLGDFDGDGAEEILTANYEQGLKVLKFRNGRFHQQAAELAGASAGGETVEVFRDRIAGIGDLNGDGKAEILIMGDEGICVLQLSSNNRLVPLVRKLNDSWFGGWRFNGKHRIDGLGDFDGDGALEVLISSDWGIGLLKQRGDTFDAYFAQPTGAVFGQWVFDRAANKIAGIGHFSGTTTAGHLVDEILITSGWGIGILALSPDTLTLHSHAAQASGTFFGRWRFDANTDRVLAIGDFNGDGRDEILIANSTNIGLLSFTGQSFDCLDQQPFGRLIGNWRLEANDYFSGVGALLRSAKRQIVIA